MLNKFCMFKKNLAFVVFILTMAISMKFNNVSAKYNFQKIKGQNRYETSFGIANEFQKGKVDNVILSSGKDFPDALSGSVLSKKLNAPILLVENNLSKDSSAIKYIKNHLDKSGKIYILGGNASVSYSYESYFKKLGYNNVERLWGKDRYETNKNVVRKLNVPKGTPVVIVNGQAFPDALSVSSAASINGYPILLNSKGDLSNQCKEILKSVNPDRVYLIGGQGVLSSNIENEIKILISKTPNV